jgi:hypothetical protein
LDEWVQTVASSKMPFERKYHEGAGR